jgi:oligopeptide/dipeptide ABC transporter ATP-binding protein
MSSAASIPRRSQADSALLRARALAKRYPVTRNVVGRPTSYLNAVRGVDLDIAPGETVALVGESGCGKSTLARLLLRLIEPSSGTVEFDGIDISTLGGGALRQFRKDAQIVFQDPFGSLDPRYTVQAIIAEGLRNQGLGGEARRIRMREVLDLVELPADVADRYPHEFSGGQRQRISIARAIAVGPRMLVLDEPVSALDVSVQSKILNLLIDLQRQLELTYLFISHDMSVVRHVADRVAVMYLGRVVELAPAAELFANPRHPYTQALLSSAPALHQQHTVRRIKLTGDVPTPIDVPPGCSFASRCFRAIDRCTREGPELAPLDPAAPAHTAACFNPAPSSAGPAVAEEG